MRPGEGQGTLWEMWGGKEPVSIPHSSTRTGIFPCFPGLLPFPGWQTEG